MRTLKWIFGTIAILFIAAVAFVFAAPYLFGDKIKAMAKKQTESYINADVDFDKVNFHFFKHFPQLTLGLTDLKVDGKGSFKDIRLAHMKEIGLSVDLMSIFNSETIQVNAIYLDEPKLKIVNRKDGSSNLQIFKESNATTSSNTNESEQFKLKLSSFSITNADLLYIDETAGLIADIKGFNHKGKGDFTQSKFDYSTNTSIADLSVESGGITMVRKGKLKYDAVLEIDNEAKKLTLKDNELSLNRLKLGADGFLNFPDEKGNVTLDFKFNAPQQSFGDLWSAIPSSYLKAVENVETKGNFNLNGHLKGKYISKTGDLPSFHVNLNIIDGYVNYPDLPKSLANINVKAKASSAGKKLNDLLIDVPQFNFNLGTNPISGKVKILNGTTDPTFDLMLKGKINLDDLKDALPLEGVEQIAGLIDIDLSAKGKSSSATTNLQAITSSGYANFNKVIYKSVNQPKIEIKQGKLDFSNESVKLTNMDIQAGKSDVVIQGDIKNPFALLNTEGKMTGNFNLRSNKLDANEWMTTETAPETTLSESEPSVNTIPFDRFDFSFSGDLKEVNYLDYDLKNLTTNGQISSQNLNLKKLDFDFDNSPMQLSGKFSNLYPFAFKNETLVGALSFYAQKVDLIKLSENGNNETSSKTSSSPVDSVYFALPENMNLTISAKVDEVLYDNLDLKDLKGEIEIADQGANFKNTSAKTLGGLMKFDGTYKYNGEENPPKFDFKYDMSNISFKQAFEKLNTVKKLAPIAAYINGNFSTNMVMSSEIGKDMMPNLNNLSAEGVINTINATIQNFTPFKKVSTVLGINTFDNMELKDTKNWFNVENGKVNIKPFDVKIKGIDAKIGGSHGLNSEMDYDIIALIPKAMLEGNAVTGAVNKGVDLLTNEASKLGININTGDSYRVKIDLTGSIEKPKVGFKLLGTENTGNGNDGIASSIKGIAEQAQDSLERLAKDKLNKAKAEAEARARKAADSIRNLAEQKAREAANRAKQQAEAEAKRIAEEARKKAEEEARKLKEKAEKEAQNIINQAEDKANDFINGIFGKKKKKKPNK